MVALLHLLSFATPSLLMSLRVVANPTPADVLHGLLARQTSAIDPSLIPDQCKSDCSVLSTLNSCSSVACICTDSNMDGIAKCLDCGAALPSANVDIKTAQSAVDLIVSNCKSAGSPVKSVTISAKKDFADSTGRPSGADAQSHVMRVASS
ncbi:hypothetical protein LshimejAT787_0101700 [Lyophyllum shimeji]|uniref:Extracellular membrane protein CFEM domain-containing protein n=1 Tax=Lyophyllum shimeji TaxID=47721 RepID=A0A9P3PD68_LYOSH|nr:hypothetical protein LshimejAT787_0101700 [Lyophyllum shimeji]